eukprot:6874344-Pyramimonas_sp.AAC.1
MLLHMYRRACADPCALVGGACQVRLVPNPDSDDETEPAESSASVVGPGEIRVCSHPSCPLVSPVGPS